MKSTLRHSLIGFFSFSCDLKYIILFFSLLFFSHVSPAHPDSVLLLFFAPSSYYTVLEPLSPASVPSHVVLFFTVLFVAYVSLPRIPIVFCFLVALLVPQGCRGSKWGPNTHGGHGRRCIYISSTCRPSG